MKVLHVLNELKYSGAEIMYVDAAPLFKEMGCELTVMATAMNLGEYAPHFEAAGYNIVHKPYPALKNYHKRFIFYRDFFQYIKKNDFDVIHVHLLGVMWGLSMCSWLAKKKSVFTIHNVVVSRRFTYLYHYLLRWSGKHIFRCKFHSISDSVYNHELKYYYNKTIKIYNWYGNKRFYPALDGEKSSLRQNLKIPSDAFIIISIGGCSHIKRHTDVIEALKKINKITDSYIYFHLGSGDTEADEIQLAQNLGIIENVRFYGNKVDVRQYLIASDVYVMPSKFEGLAITTVEAMACLIPSILYNVPGLRDFNVDGENSILIEEDYSVLAEKIVWVRNNKLYSNQIAQNAKRFVESNFSIEKNVELIYKLYV